MEQGQEENVKPTPQTVRLNKLSVQASVGDLTPWLTYSFAPEWFEDALKEAQTGRDHHSRRREILYAVCCVESYLFEWVRDEVLSRKFDELTQYFPYGDRRGILDRWKKVIKALQKDNRIRKAPDFGLSYWNDFRKLVEYRDGLVHGKPSRPETSSLRDEQKPVPSKTMLDQLPSGWAVRVVVGVIRRLHEAVGTSTPSWLAEP